jgi:methylglyoxal reductase
MELRTIGKTGIKATAICYGAWAIGGGTFWGESDDDESVRAIETAIDEGITFIDTAPAYGFGRSEEVVGRAVKGKRDKVVISTKCGLWWKGTEGSYYFSRDGKDIYKCLKPETIRIEIEDSLRRIGTDYIDVYITHWQEVGENPTPIAETMHCLEDLKREGKIRAIGASNTSLEDIREYSENGRLDIIQERYTMLDRHLEPDYIDVCEELGISIMGYSTIEQGLLAGKFGMDDEIPEGEYRNRIPWYEPENRKKVLDMLGSWDDLLKKYDCTVGQLVIAWTAAQRGITFPLVGARKVRHAKENAAAGELTLDPQDLKRMRRDAEALGEPE